MTKRIMAVDDESDQIYTIKQALETFGDEFEVITAESGMQCHQLLKDNQIHDLILLDIMMPEMSGWETFKRLKNNPLWKNIPIIFLTARTDKMAKDSGSFLGDDYITKPFDTFDLKRKIVKLLENSSLEQQH